MKNVPEHQKPDKIMKFENIIDQDPDSGINTYKLKIDYITANNDRFRYYYRKRHGDDHPQVSIDRVTKHLFFGLF